MDWKRLEDVVYAAAASVVGDRALTTSPLLEAIRDRSARYTSDRDRLAKPASPTGDLAARAVFFTLADAPKIGIPLRELAARSALPARLRVVDLGAGCGAMSLGALAALNAPLEITAIDRDREALQIAAAAVTAFSPTATFTTKTDDATRVAVPPADLVLMGTLLNELDAPARLALVRRALAAISDDGAVIIIEPALRETTRALHELRDALLVDNGAHVFAPCTRQGAPCPALADPTDWCLEHRSVKLPPRTAELARLTHLRDDGLKFSYLVLRKAAATLSDDPAAWRITGSAWAQKGKVEVLACSNAGRTKLRLLKKNRVGTNRALESVERGDVVTLDAQLGDDRIEVLPETMLTISRPGGDSTA
ncbi:MAG TPA: small ribosomal subunit Rsm22 family protein [Kofleriaceae bacterium]|jgi:precorrin-6B methylase 2